MSPTWADQEGRPVAQPDDHAEAAEAVVQPAEPLPGGPVPQASAVELDDFPGDRPFCEDLNGPTHDEMWPPLPPLEVRLRAIYFTPSGKPVLNSWWLAA